MKVGSVLAAAAMLVLGAQASSAAIVLDFTGLDNASFADGPLNYYAGGLSLEGNGPGPNFGVSFTDNAFTCATTLPTDACNGLATPPGPGNLLLFGDPSPGPFAMNVAGGFNSISLYYNNIFSATSLGIYGGLNGTGTLLATLDLPVTDGSALPECATVPLCPFVLVGTGFGGLAHSVDFSAAKNIVEFADIALDTVGVPEPLTLCLFGGGLAGAAALRRRSRLKT